MIEEPGTTWDHRGKRRHGCQLPEPCPFLLRTLFPRLLAIFMHTLVSAAGEGLINLLGPVFSQASLSHQR